MKRGDHLQQAAAPLNNYQFDFGLPGMPKPSGSLKDQRAQTLNSGAQVFGGWSASPAGRASNGSGPDGAFDFAGRSYAGGSSNPNANGQARPQTGGSASTTHDFLGVPSSVGGVNGGYYGSARPQVGNAGGVNSFSHQTASNTNKGGVDLSGKVWAQSTASKLASAGIPGYKPSSKEDVFGDLLGGALGGKSSTPLKQQQQQHLAATGGGFGMSNLQAAMPEVAKAPVRDAKPAQAKPAPFSYTAMFKSSTPSAQKTAPKPKPMANAGGGDSFSGLSFSKPQASAMSSDPFNFVSKQQNIPPPAQSVKAPISDPFAGSAGGDQFDSIFGSGMSSSRSAGAKPAQAHDGWGEAFGAAAESHSFENEAATTELEGVGAAPPGLAGNSAFEKGSTFYKEGQFPDAIKWFSWAVELLEKEKGKKDTIIHVLTKRMSCFKEIGEMKKAIADGTKVWVRLSSRHVYIHVRGRAMLTRRVLQ